jgi:hypothetical protein
MDPISPFLQMGLGLGGVIVCTSLFIWNTVELRRNGNLKDSLEAMTKEMFEHRKLTVKIIEDHQKEMAKMAEQVATLAANQLNLTHSVNEVVRELIGIIREVEKT